MLCRLLSLTLALPLLASCAEPQRPYVFSTAQMAREPIDALEAALRQAGIGPIVVDPKTGMIHSRWLDTGVRNGTIRDQQATLVRRYTATVLPGRFGNDVSVRADVQRCVVREFTLTELDVQGNCEPLERLIPQQQEELMRVGQRVQASMSIP